MQTNTYEPVVIFSANPGKLLDYCNLMVKRGHFRGLEGSYKGEREPSFMLNAHDFHVQGLASVLADDGQESILFLDNQRNAFLRFAPDYAEAGQKWLGVWHHVPKAVALARDAWTRDPQSDLYYVAG